MRLFIAIKFSEEIKKELLRQISELKENTLRGNFTRIENLHLTLAFIGESQRVTDIKRIIDEAADGCFDITLSGSGRFGSLYWVGLKKEQRLFTLANKLREMLDKNGLPVDKKPFSPHITIAREIVSENPVKLNIKEVSMPVSRISLMRSDRINGKLTYTEVYGREL